MQPIGTAEPEKRRGSHPTMVEDDKEQTKNIIVHKNQFDRGESHYIPSETSKEYLRLDLIYQEYTEHFVNKIKIQPPSLSGAR